jgi:aminoglycoside phosphotransferase (APT) family kinase protein
MTVASSEADPREHPAVVHWRRLTNDVAERCVVTVLEHERGMPSKTAVYRLEGIGPGGGSVVAKRSRRRKAAVEQAVYEHVLPRLSLRTLHYYGCVEEPETPFAWQYLEDAGGRPWSARNDRDQALAARWLATLHGESGPIRASGLPEKSPAFFLDLLRAARSTVAERLEAGVADEDASRLLRSVGHQCAQLEERWDKVARLCDDFPETVMHGDFTAKNLRVLERNGEPELVPLDWEGAGWGVPALDLRAVDAAGYHAAITASWPSLGEAKLRAARTAGRIFWHVSALRWSARDAAGETADEALAKMRRHHEQLESVLARIDNRPPRSA